MSLRRVDSDGGHADGPAAAAAPLAPTADAASGDGGADDDDDDDDDGGGADPRSPGDSVDIPLLGADARRHMSLEELAYAIVKDEVLADEDLAPHDPLEFAHAHADAASATTNDDHAAPPTAHPSGPDLAAIEETAFGLPHVELDDHREARRSSLQMIAAAARELRDMHRASSHDLTDPVAVRLVAARQHFWRVAAATAGFALLFADALVVLLVVPLRVGFLFDPWAAHSAWTPLLTGLTVGDALGELVRSVYLWRSWMRRRQGVQTTTPTTTTSSPDANPPVFVRPPRKSLFSTRGSVATPAAVQAADVLPAARQRPQRSLAALLLLGTVPLEPLAAAVDANFLHVTCVLKLLAAVTSLPPSFRSLLLTCRRFRWVQWLSFSTLATPFYLFWLGLYLCHLSACGYMLLANIECGLHSQHCAKTPLPGSWVLKDSMEAAGLWRRYIRSMYWASKTVTTLGQGDLVPATLWETNYCIVVQFVSGLWATAFLASCSFYFSRRDKDIENGVSTRLDQALRFLRSRRVPQSLALQIRNYYQHIQRTRNGIEEDRVLANLPAHYRSQCSFFVKYRHVAKIPFFAKQPKAFLRSVADHIESDFLSSKQTILALFEPLELIIVARGDLRVLDQSKVCVRVVGEGEWYGEDALLDDSRSKFELEAKNYCEILRLSRTHFVTCMEKHFPRLKIAALVAQQKRRMAMIPSTDVRLQDVSKDAATVAGRTSGRSTIAKVLQQAFGNSDAQNDISWQHSGSRFRQIWRRWKAVLLIFLAVEVPFEIAFEWRIGFFGKSVSLSQQIMYVVVIAIEVFFYIDWYFRAFMFARTSDARLLKRDESAREVTQRSMREDLVMAAAAVKAKDGVITNSGGLVRLYLLQGNVLFDVVVNIPIAMVWNFMDQSSYSIETRELMRFARLLSFGRLAVLKQTLRKIMVEHDLSPASQLLAFVVVFCVVSANAMACYFYLLADDKAFVDALPLGFDPELTPVTMDECLQIATLTANCTWFMFDRSKYAIHARYIRSMHWSLVLLSTVGYGDILSFSNSECMIGFWWIYLGALICYFTSCAVGSVISQVTVLTSAQDARVEAITRALVRTSVSPAMRILIRSHYETNWEMNGSALSETSLMEHLPRSLRHQLSTTLYVQGIRRCYVFSCLGGQAAMLREIALRMTSEQFLPGVTIVENGHLASALYLVQSGEVELLLPYESSQRFASNARRRSVLVSQKHLQNPMYRLYLRLLAVFRPAHHTTASAADEDYSSKISITRSIGVPIAALKEGDCFGEEGLLADQRSSLRISARTLTGTQVATLKRDAFMSLAGQFPVQVRQIVTLIAKKQETDLELYDTIRGNFRMRPKAVEFMGMSPSLYVEVKPQVHNIITPDRFRYRVWHFVHGLILVYNFYSITFRLAFVSNPSSGTMLGLTIVDYLMDAFLYADIYLKWNRFGFEEHGDHIVDLSAIRRRYKKGWFRVDCWSMLPTFYYGGYFGMTLARLPRLLKSLQLFENISAIESRIRERFMKGSTTLLSVFDLCKFLLFFLSAAHQIGSVYFLLGRILTENDLVEHSWMTVDPILEEYPGDIAVQYVRSIYWCLETFTVVCFGDVIAQSAPETVYASSTCIIGWMCIGQVVGRITSLMANIDKDTSDRNDLIDKFEKFAHEKQLPQFLRERAIESIEYKSKCLVELNLRDTFQDLPPALHAMLFEEMYGSCVRRVPELVHAMKAPQLRVLADALTLHIYVVDDIILEEGRLGTTLYIMKEGCAEYFSTQSLLVFAAIYENQLFGDKAFFVPGARHALSVRASRSCQVLQLDRRTWNDLWDEKSRKLLEEKLELLALQKIAATELAHANIARNFDLSSGVDGAQIPRRDESLALGRVVNTTTSRLAQYRSNLKGYTTMLSAINAMIWGGVSRKVAPVIGYRPLLRRGSSRKTNTGGSKLRRSLGVGVGISVSRLANANSNPTKVLLNDGSTSTYTQHLETMKTRFHQRQERTMFSLDQLATSSSLSIEKEHSISEIWIEPPLPPSFCLEYSTFRRVWNAVMYFICLYYILVVPFRVSFDYEFLSGKDNETSVQAWFVIEYLMDLLCVADFVLHKNYFTYVHRGTLITEKHAIRDHYFREGSYLVDLFCITPFELLLPFAPLENAPGTDAKVSWYRIAVFRLNKMVRIVHLHELGDKLQRMLVYDVKTATVRPSLIYFSRFAFDFALGAHWVACMFYGASFNGINDDYASWLKTPGMLTFEGRNNVSEVGKVPVEIKYARSYHFSMGAITTVSYGDIAPQNAWETFLGTFVIVISIVLFGMLSGGFSQVFEMELGQRADYEEKIASVAHFMLFHQFPTRIWRHMQSYFMVHWSESHGMNDDELLGGLPLSVKNDLSLFVKQDFVKQMKLFHGCDESFVRAVVAAFDQELFVRNDVIITYGDRGRSLFVIESGSVLVRIPQPTGLDREVVKHRYDFFGEKSLIFDIPRSATCLALTSCSMLILTVDKYDLVIEQFPEYREKNMCDWIFTSGDKQPPSQQAIRRLPTATNARRLRAASKKLRQDQVAFS